MFPTTCASASRRPSGFLATSGIRQLQRELVHIMSDASIVGHPLGTGNDRPSKAFRKGRVCSEDGCGTRLSLYNPGKFCALHEPMTVPRTRGKKIA